MNQNDGHDDSAKAQIEGLVHEYLQGEERDEIKQAALSWLLPRVIAMLRDAMAQDNAFRKLYTPTIPMPDGAIIPSQSATRQQRRQCMELVSENLLKPAIDDLMKAIVLMRTTGIMFTE